MIIGITLLVFSLAQLLIGFRFIFRYQRNQALVWYGLFAIGIAIYAGANGLGYLFNNFYIAERVGWVGGIMTAIFILPFSQTFPLPQRSVRELIPLAVWPILVFIPGLLFTDLFLNDYGIINYRAGYQTLTGPYYPFVLIFFSIYWLWGLFNLFRSMVQSDGRHRWQLRMILLGLVASLLVSVIFDILMPLVTKSMFGYVGSMFSAIWLGFTSYILLKK